MARSSYRAYLKLCEKWPLDKTKVNRDLGELLRTRISAAYRQGENSIIDDPNCDVKLQSLLNIASNKHGNKYPRSVVSSSMGLNREECQQAVSTEGLAALNMTQSMKVSDKLKSLFSFKILHKQPEK